MTQIPKLKGLVLLLILTILLVVPVSFGLELVPLNQEYTLWADVTANGEFYDAFYAQITLIDPNQTTQISNQNMTKLSTGVFYYNYTFDTKGEWFGFVEFYNTTDNRVAIASQTLIVRDSIEDFLMIPIEILIILITGFLTFMAWYIKNYGLFIGIGLFYIIIPFIVDLTVISIPTAFGYIFFMLAGIGIIYQGISFTLTERKQK